MQPGVPHSKLTIMSARRRALLVIAIDRTSVVVTTLSSGAVATPLPPTMKSFLSGILLLTTLFGASNAFVFTAPTFAFPPTQVSSLQMTVLSYNGKKKNFKPGSPLSKAVAALGVKPTYSCKK